MAATMLPVPSHGPISAQDALSTSRPQPCDRLLQEELKKRALDAKWTPLKGKKELVDRLQVRLGPPRLCTIPCAAAIWK